MKIQRAIKFSGTGLHARVYLYHLAQNFLHVLLRSIPFIIAIGNVELVH